MKHKPQGLHVSPLPSRTSLICCTHMMQPHSHHSFFVLGHQPRRIHLCLKLYIVHVNTFPSPNSRQLLNPGRLNDGSGQCPAVTSGAFIICLVGWLCPSFLGHAAPRSSDYHTSCTGQQLSFSACHLLRGQHTSPTVKGKGVGWGGGGVKRSAASFPLFLTAI